MSMDEFSTERLLHTVGSIADDVRSALKREKGEDYDERSVKDAIAHCVVNKLESLEEDMLEMFTSPGRREFQELAVILEQRAPTTNAAFAVEEMAYLAEEFGDTSVFEGFRPFSKTKMAAMIEYLTAKGHNVYKTSLNKLLFYGDLTYFYLRNQGMSGAVYHNRPYGPVADTAGPILSELIRDVKVKVVPRTQTLEAETTGDTAILSGDEQKVLDWVADTYGGMTAGEISGLSHREMAYKYTEPNEPIAYAYAKFLKHLPPKDFLS